MRRQASFYDRPPQGAAGRVPFEWPVEISGDATRLGALLRARHEAVVPRPSRRCDVVVVGAGLSGLAAAHTLRDADVLVLEQSARPGGHARSGAWQGVTYAEGTSYLTDPDDDLRALIDTLGVRLLAVPPEADAYQLGSRRVVDFWGGGAEALPLAEAARRAFRRFRADVAALKDGPRLPIETASARALACDRVSLEAAIRAYGPELARYMDLYCRAALGGGVSEVSAYAALAFFAAELKPRLSAPGGLAVLGTALAEAVGRSRLVTGAAVTRVAPHGEGAWVTYEANGERVTVAAGAVVMACAKHVSRQVVEGLPDAQRRAMARLRYEPYVVVNVLVDGPVAREAFDVWTDGAPFTDVTVADWLVPARGPHHVLTAYCPLSESARPSGLTDAAVTALAHDVVLALEAMYPGLASRVVGLRAHRRAHPLVLSAVGALTALAPVIARPFGPVCFANTDNQLVGAAEAALHEGRKAALQALARLSRAHRAG